MKRALATVIGLICLGIAPSANAAFGVADVNTGLPGDPDVPAFPGQKAIWAGTCNLSVGSTANGGVGTAPAIRSHCIDVGGLPSGFTGGDVPWPPGQEPAYRLDPEPQAGAHPDASAAFWFNMIEGFPDGSVKNIIVRLPPGVVGNPETVPKCPAFAAQAVPADCDAASQVGITTIGFPNFANEVRDFQTKPVYVTEPRDTVTAEFVVSDVATLFNVPVTARGRTNSDFGVDTLALLIPDFVALTGQSFTLWGVPWAEEHDRFRVDGVDTPHGQTHHVDGFPAAVLKAYEPSWGPIRPFVTNATECTGKPLAVGVDIDSWQNPVSDGGSYVSAEILADTLAGCDKLQFDPSITLKPTVSVSDSPSGLDVALTLPQNNDPPAEALGNPNLPFDPADDTGAPAYWDTPAGLGRAHLKNTVVSLPAGTSFNPAAANGVEGCTASQIGLVSTKPRVSFNNDPVKCPESSKMGTLKIDSPLLPDPLFGDVYLAAQNDNPFPGTLTAAYLVAQDDERGLSIKLPGRLDLDPDTGQISTTFLDNPQLPFEKLELHFKTGPRAPLNTPPVCGQFKNSISLIPWSFPASGPEPVIEDPFAITSMPNGFGCVNEPEDRVFAPGFEAGSTNTQAKTYTSFLLNVTRRDGEQEISAIAFDAPPGLSANLTETPYCPEYAIDAVKQRSGREESLSPSCPEASRMGTVSALAGAGPTPLPTEGRLYIAGPYDPDGAGPKPLAPFSTVVVAPAIAGGTPGNPAFDLGNVVIRSAGYVDSRTAQVHIDSTKAPYIVGGIPLRLRRILVAIEKPNFMLNPTSCAVKTVGGTLGGAADPLDSTDDVSVSVSNRFQLGGCENLGFKPKLNLRLFGGTKRAQYQRLRAELLPRPGDANVATTAVTLPRSSFLAQEHIRTICTRVQFAQNACPEGSIYGNAIAYTPLLKDPVQGPVYLRASDNQLPDLVASLKGQFDVELVGRIDSVKGGIRSSFDVVPDAPVSKFVLNMFGGQRSLIVNSRDICKFPSRATVRMSAFNGRQLNYRSMVKNSCRGKKKGKRGGKGKRGSGR